MSKQLDVTVAQAMEVRSMALAKGISRKCFQRGLTDGTFATALEVVKEGRRIMLAPNFEPPPGGRIYILRVPVVLDRDWHDAINAAGPNTPDNYDVRKVGDLYLPTGTGVVEKEAVLLNFGLNGGSWDRAIAWARQYPVLKKTDPRLVFAICEYHPLLHRELNVNPMFVVATQECSFEGNRQACNVWSNGVRREAYLRWVNNCGSAYDWFAFSRE